MTSADVFEVRVSRWLLLVLFLAGLLFLAAGLEIAIFHAVLGEDFGRDAPLLRLLFLVFAIGAGGVIALNCLLYLVAPPLMLRVTGESISFGSGLRYRPFGLPASAFEKAEIFTAESDLEVLGKRKIVEGGVHIYFKKEGDFPSQKTTSMGLAYYNYRLTVFSRYAGKTGTEILQGIAAVLKRS